MKRLLLCMLCMVGSFLPGCDLEIPAEEAGSINHESMCLLTGGEYKLSNNSNDYRCFCDGYECGENVTCKYKDESGDRVVCSGMAYTLLPSGPCMMEGVIVCDERIDAKGVSQGYQTSCVDHQWTAEQSCGGNSCKLYKVTEQITSSKCGDCTNDGVNCISGEYVQ